MSQIDLALCVPLLRVLGLHLVSVDETKETCVFKRAAIDSAACNNALKTLGNPGSKFMITHDDGTYVTIAKKKI
jgi:hypothetical protein